MSILNKVSVKLPGRNEDAPYYLALLITYRGVETSLFMIEDSYLSVIQSAKADFKGSGNILETAAEAIDAACERQGVDVKDVILGLPDSWISQNQILPQYFDKLNELAKDLDLSPFAFVALNHAVANRLKILYGTLLSGYLLNIDNENLTLSSIVSGQLKETRFIKSNHGEFAGSVQKLFAHFANDPAIDTKIYVYGTPIPADTATILETLAIFSQAKPTVVILDDVFANRAIALAGAVDRGNTLSIHVEERPEQQDQERSQLSVGAAIPPVVVAPVLPQAETAASVSPTMPLEEMQSDNLTLADAIQQDQQAANEEHQKEKAETKSPLAPTEPAVVPTTQLPEGFSVANEQELEQYAEAGVPVVTHPDISQTPSESDQVVELSALQNDVQPDVASTSRMLTTPQHAVPESMAAQVVQQPAHPVASFPPQQNMPHFDSPSTGGTPDQAVPVVHSYANQHDDKGRLSSLPKNPFGIISFLPNPSGIVRVLIGRGALLLIPIILLIIVAVAYVSIVKANVVITFTPKSIEGDKALVVSPKATTTDSNSGTIPGTLQTTDVMGTIQGTATGQKKIGDKAKGTVTLYNKTSQPKTFTSGTTLTANNLNFTLDSTVTVPASKIDESSPDSATITYGKVSGNATAADIGTDSNIPASTQLIVKGQTPDTVSATVATAFTGGTSRNVTVISDADVAQAQKNLGQTLKDQAKTNLLQKVGDNEKVIDESVTVTIIKQSTDQKVGDEASAFTLSATAHAQALLYSMNDLTILLTSYVNDQKPQGYDLLHDATPQTPTFKSIDKNGVATLAWHYQAKLAPQLPLDDIKQQIARKSVGNAQTKLHAMQDVADVTITLSPKIVNVINYMPFRANNITISTTAQ